MKVSIIAFDDFTDLDLFILWDLLNRVDIPNWQVMLLGDKETHTSSTGIEVKMHGLLDEANSSAAVLFSSGKGTRKKITDQAFLEAFHLDERRQLIGAIDSGTLLLGALGLLKGKRVTTYPSIDTKELLQGMGADVVSDAFVKQGNVASAAQCLSGQFLAGWVIENLAGSYQSEKVLQSVAPLGNTAILPSPSHSSAEAPAIQLRLASPGDAALVVSVLKSAFIEYRRSYTDGGFAATVLNQTKVKARMAEGPMWVALHDGVVVGTVAAVSKGEALHVRGMGIVPAARGKKIGRLLLTHVEEFGRRHGHTRMTLNTTPFLARAIRLYEHFGFKRNDKGPLDLFGTPLFSMEKALR